jgi:hypothetical protein
MAYVWGAQVTDDGKTLLLASHETCDPVNRLYYFDLTNFDGADIKTIGAPSVHCLASGFLTVHGCLWPRRFEARTQTPHGTACLEPTRSTAFSAHV